MNNIGNDAVRTDETSPLLGVENAAPDISSQRPRWNWVASSTSITSFDVPKTRDPDRIVAIACVLIFISASSGGFFAIPMTRVLEDRFCQEYYSGIRLSPEPIDEALCKVEIVQSRLAYVFAANSFLEALLGCLVALPWGLVADRIGRRPVFVLGLIGMSLESIWQISVGWFSDVLPVRLYSLGPLGILIGGGNAVLSGTLSSLMSDILPEGDRAVGFMRIHIASMFGNLCSPMISSFMMPRVGPWPLLCLSVIIGVAPAIGMVFIPETLSTKKDAHNHNDTHQSPSFSTRLSHSVAELKDSLSMLNNPSVVLLMLAMMNLMPVILCTLQFLSQFTSKRYHIELAYTGYVQGAYGSAHVFVILLVIPFLAKLALRPNSPGWIRMPSEKHRDLTFTRWSFVALVLGTLVMSFAPVLPVFILGLFVMAFGSGAGSYISSILAFYVDKEHRTRIFSLAAIMHVLGSIYAEPMLASLFTLGMRFGGIWIGLPYLGIALLSGVSLVLLAFVRLPKESVGSGV